MAANICRPIRMTHRLLDMHGTILFRNLRWACLNCGIGVLEHKILNFTSWEISPPPLTPLLMSIKRVPNREGNRLLCAFPPNCSGRRDCSTDCSTVGYLIGSLRAVYGGWFEWRGIHFRHIKQKFSWKMEEDSTLQYEIYLGLVSSSLRQCNILYYGNTLKQRYPFPHQFISSIKIVLYNWIPIYFQTLTTVRVLFIKRG